RELTELLQEVVGKEGIAVDPTVLPLVVRAAAGSARDGLSILDQVLASAGENGVTREVAAGLLGVTPDTLLDDVVDAFAARDSSAVFDTVDRVMEGGHDPRRFAQDVLERLRDLVVLDAVPDAGPKGLLDCPADQLERMGRQATMMGSAGLSRAADLFADGLTEMRGTTAPRLLLELVCARVLLPAAATDAVSVLSRVERLERRLDITGATPPPPAPAPVPTVAPDGAPTQAARPPVPVAPPPAAAAPARVPPAPAPVRKEQSWPTAATPGGPPADPPQQQPSQEPAATPGLDAAAIRREWDRVLVAVREAKKSAYVALGSAQVARVDGGTLVLAFNAQGAMRNFQGGANVDHLRDALRDVLGVDLAVRCVFEGVEPAPAGARPVPVADDFAPGDEAVPDDPDEPAPPPSVRSGEDVALALVQAELGGKVVETLGEPGL
ncbi:MAG: DNA polymerase III subunit gamma/tau, partial [Mycobacteriales bacterium]